MKKIDIQDFGKYGIGLSLKDVMKYLQQRAETYHLSYEDVCQEFNNWIGGQTCPMLPNSEKGFYRVDVKRFADKIFDNKPTYFD